MKILGTFTLMVFCVGISIGDNLAFSGRQDSSLHRNGRDLANESAGLSFGKEFEPNLNFSVNNLVEQTSDHKEINLEEDREANFSLSSVPDHPNVEACHQNVETGVCRAYLQRWYFDASAGTCNKFVYGGCQGNRNNFDKESKCYATCKGEIPCPSDPQKVCRITESLCLNTTCPGHPDAECRVLPCTCEAVFEDSAGQVVNCFISQNISVVYDGRASDVLVSEGNDTDIPISEGTGNDLQTSSGNASGTIVSVSNGVDTDVPVSEVGDTDNPVSDDRNTNNSVSEDTPDAPVSKGNDTVTEKPDSTVTDVPEMVSVTPTETTVPPTEPPYIEPMSRTAAMWIIICLCFFLILVVAIIGYKRWKRCHGPYLYIPARRPNRQTLDFSDRERESFTEAYSNKPDEGSGV